MEPGFDRVTEGKVTCTLLATLAPPSERRLESAGWYVICNGRIVLAADKTEVTGWGAAVLPTFQPKFSAFCRRRVISLGRRFLASVDDQQARSE
jgi:hypothetical protein